MAEAIAPVINDFCSAHAGWRAIGPWTHPSLLGPAGAQFTFYTCLPKNWSEADGLARQGIRVDRRPNGALGRPRQALSAVTRGLAEIGIVRDGDDVRAEVRKILISCLRRLITD